MKEFEFNLENIKPEYKLPEVIDTPYPCVASGDLYDVISKIIPSITEGELFSFQKRLFSIQEKYAPKGTTFYSFSSKALAREIENQIEIDLNDKDKKIGTAILDRYIGEEFSTNNVIRLNISRGNKEGNIKDIISRPGTSISPQEQMKALIEWGANFQEISLVDDVLAFGSTLVPIVKTIREGLPQVDISVKVGLVASGGIWRGYEYLQEETGIIPEYITLIKASPPTDATLGMSIPTSRDMSIFGGYLESNAPKNLPICYPHLLPFTIPRPSFMQVEKRFEASNELLILSQDIVNYMDMKAGKKLTLNDFIKNGFAIPYTNINGLSEKLNFPDTKTTMIDYISQIYSVFESNTELINQAILAKKID